MVDILTLIVCSADAEGNISVTWLLDEGDIPEEIDTGIISETGVFENWLVLYCLQKK